MPPTPGEPVVAGAARHGRGAFRSRDRNGVGSVRRPRRALGSAVAHAPQVLRALVRADEVWLLQTGGGLSKGAPEDLVLNGIFEAVFDKEGILFDKATGTFNMHQGTGNHIRLAGEGASVFWTKRALMRQGFTVAAPLSPSSGQEVSDHSIQVSEKDGRAVWVLKQGDRAGQYDSIADLLNALK